MARIDKDAVLSELRREAEEDRLDREAAKMPIVQKYEDPWYPANQDSIPEVPDDYVWPA